MTEYKSHQKEIDHRRGGAHYAINKRTGEFIEIRWMSGGGTSASITLSNNYFFIERQRIRDSDLRETLMCFDFPRNLNKIEIEELRRLATK